MCLADRDGTGIPQRLEPLMAITKYSVDDYEGDDPARRAHRERPGGAHPGGDRSQDGHRTSAFNLCQGARTNSDSVAAGRAIAGVQDSVRLPSEPEPDISLVRPPKERYLTRISSPLISSSSSRSPIHRWMTTGDITRPLYAESGIQEFRIANLRDNCLEVYRGPRPDGTYQERGSRTVRARTSPPCRVSWSRSTRS